MRKFICVPICVLMCVVCIPSCDEITKGDDSLDKIVFPESQISYNRHVQPLFNIACATSGCHDVQTKAADLDLTDHFAAIHSKFGVVIPQDTLNSRLIWNIEGRPGSNVMPPQRSLTLNQIRGLKTWIMEGATDSIP